MKNKYSLRVAFLNRRFLIGLVVSLICGLVALLSLADSSTRVAGDQAGHVYASIRNPQSTLCNRVEARTFARVTPEGIITEKLLASQAKSAARETRLHRAPAWQAPERPMLEPLGNTLWQVDDQNAIADGVAIDANDVWGAWTLQSARLSAYPILGDGIP